MWQNMRDELQVVARMAQEEPVDVLPRLLGGLEEIRCVAMARLSSATATPLVEPEQLISVAEVAHRLCQSKDFVYDHQQELGGRKQGSSLRFLASRIDEHLRQGGLTTWRHGAMFGAGGRNGTTTATTRRSRGDKNHTPIAYSAVD
jgi:hypothetical protein